ncbi:beta-galactosidase [Anaerosporobacter faecicola]|uniref:beta-galactosidase n=1 Tax=Anaerosporobacter faecicola TaxID=2718714 RepID=UPI001438A4E3|nr:beta-galactosidase [Anaerosporobacter faecicola]
MKIGVNYYPEQWDKVLWKNDITQMAEVGVKVVRLAEFAWSRLEPTEGVYDFGWLDEVIALLEEKGIEVILGTPTNCPPLWLYEKYPDAVMCDEYGNKVTIGIRGHRCYNSPSMIKKTKQIVSKMAEHYGKSKAVVSWQIDNELEAYHCTCEACTEKFRTWLKLKYGSLEQMNKTYGTAMWSGEYSDWSQVKPPMGKQQHWLNPGFLMDHYRFASESMEQFVRLQTACIREFDKTSSITTNMYLGNMTPDFYNTFQDLSYASYDNYPVTVIPDGKEEIYSHAFHLDLTRGIKRKNFCIMEELSGAPGCWMPICRTPKPNMVKGYALQAIARGADLILHFRWRSAMKGAEMFWHGILDHNNVQGRRYQEFRSLCETVHDQLGFLEGTVIKNKVALLFSHEQDNAFKFQQQAQGFHYYSQLKLFHNGVMRTGAGIDIINMTEDLSGYEVIIAPTIYIASQKVVDNLTLFVENGGKLILTNRTGVKDETNACVMENLPGPFAPLVGAYVEEYDALGDSKNIVQMRNGNCYTCSQWADILQEDTAQVLGVYGEDFYKGKAAITQNTYGKGTIYYIGTILERDFYYDFMMEVFRDTTVERMEDLPDGVERSIREDLNHRYMLLFNNTSHIQKINIVDQEPFELQPFDLHVIDLRS